MSRSILTAIIRHAEALGLDQGPTTDAELVRRFARDRDAAAFAELVRRHGPMVWAVCRHLVPRPADAEDAFQATFLALVKSAGAIRDPAGVGGWLHGVAVRVTTKLKRGEARRRDRERAAAAPEGDRPVPDAAWEAVLAAVHEEVRLLPDPLRAAFVLCDLEGVRQPDAAARLGWKLGTLSGRLTRARQRLLERLTGRGLCPAAAVGAMGLGVAAAVPAGLADKAASLAGAGGAVPAAVAKLVREVVPMTANRVKVLVAAVLVAGGLAAGVGPAVVARLAAQAPGDGGPGAGGGLPPGPGGFTGGMPGVQPGGFPPGPGGLTGPRSGFTGQPPPGLGSQPGPSGAQLPPGGAGTGGSTWRAQWEYLIAGKPADPLQFSERLARFGDQGWEYVGTQEFDPAALLRAAKADPAHFVDVDRQYVMVFKRPKAGGAAGGRTGFDPGPRPGIDIPGSGPVPVGQGPRPMGPGPGGTPPRPGGGEGAETGPEQGDETLREADAAKVAEVVREHFRKKGSTAFVAVDPMTNRVIVSGTRGEIAEARRMIRESDRTAADAPAPPEVLTFRLKNARAGEVAKVLSGVFAGRAGFKAVADPATNSVVVTATPLDAATVRKLLEQVLDAPR